MGNIISFVHISLDGFVSGPNGEMNWIKVDEELFDHIGKRIGQTSSALYGRKTYEMMESYWPNQGKEPDSSKHDIEHSRWYNNARKVVLSKSMKDKRLPNTTVISDNLSEELAKIKQQAGQEILLFGSPTATHSLMQQNLIDGYWLFVNPVVLGQGVPLFVAGKEKTKLKLLTTSRFNSGVVELSYLVDRQ